MNPIYYKSESTAKPNFIDVQSDAVYLHRNITSRVDETVNPPVTIYSYEEAKLTIEEFNSYANSLLMSGQENTLENQLTIMEAFADLYETIAFNL